MISIYSSAEMDSNEFYSENLNVLTRAYCDLIFLLDRGYPKFSALSFVANHYLISKEDRSILNRAAISLNDVIKIKSNKIENPHTLEGKELVIDLYNQYTLYQTVLDGEPVILGRDGVLRDIFSVLHSKNELRFNYNTIKSFLIGFKELKPKYITLCFDKQRSKSGEHTRIFKDILQQMKIDGDCLLLKAVDHHLKIQKDSITISHDSIILKETNLSFDFINWYIKEKNLREKSKSRIISFYCDKTTTKPL
jgi:hypothetical protein